MKSKVLNKLFDGRDVIIEVDENNNLFFEVESVSMAIGYITTAKGKEYVHKSRMNKTLKNAEISTVVHGVQQFMSESQLYSFLIEAHTQKSKEFQKWLTEEVLPAIEKTGAYIESGREQEMVNYYFSSLSQETQGIIVNELIAKNKELQQFYDDLINTTGLYSMNIIAKELKIGRNTLFSYLRGKSIMFYHNGSNIPYQRFMNQGLFRVIESPCADGEYRPTTYATKKGLDYLRKLLHKDGYYNVEVA